MTPHKWEIEEVNGGPAGNADVWICRACGLGGGFAWPGKSAPWMKPFLAGAVIQIEYPEDDCEEAKRLIEELLASDAYQEKLRQFRRDQSKGLMRSLGHLVGGKIDRDGTIHGGNGKHKFQIHYTGNRDGCTLTIDGVSEHYDHFWLTHKRLETFFCWHRF